MKSFLIRPALALALAAGLAGCGGSDKAEFTVGGTVYTLLYPGLQLKTNGAVIDVAPPAKAGDTVTYAFPNKLEYGDEYNVQIERNPQHQSCQLTNPNYATNADTAGRLAEINVQYVCSINQFSIGGTITGLTADGLVLANGSTGGTYTAATPATPPATTPITYALPLVKFGTTYGVTVTRQPAGQVCTVVNPTGTMGDAAVTNVNVTCVAA